jgi:DNA-binding Lrp family transcriptional regulator
LERYKSPKGTHSVEATNKKVQQLRGALVAVERAMGVPLSEIAKKYHISTETAKRYLDTAQEAGFIEHFRALIYERLVGKAMAVYEAKLEMGDLEAARDIAFGLGVLNKNPGKGTSEPKPIDTLAAYRAERMKNIVEVPVAPKGEPDPNAK